MTISDIALYDPWRLKEDDLVAGFVARVDLCDFFLRQLRSLDDAAMASHQLVVGQRGMGKTTLLRRLAIGISADETLCARFAPLTFREEQYDVQTLAHFSRNCSEALAEWLEKQGQAKEADAIDKRLALRRITSADEAWTEFAEFISTAHRRPVLFIDNIDLVLGALNEEEGWKLRRILQERGGPVVIGASAMFLEETTNPKAPFYEFFQVHKLEPLNAAEMHACLARLAERRGLGGQRVLATMGREPERIQVLHRLTGGNPRTLAFIYLLLESEDAGDVQRDLEALLDSVTGLYKARVEELSPQARAVFDAIALNWDPAPLAAIGEKTMLEVTTISPQLNRLVERGFIEKVERGEGKSGWQVAERFFNIWYLMRHGGRRAKLRLRWLVSFLSNFYSRDELARMGRDLLDRGLKTARHATHAFALAEATDDPIMRCAIQKRATSALLRYDRSEIERMFPLEDLDQATLALDDLRKKICTARSWHNSDAEKFFEVLRLSGRNQRAQRKLLDKLPTLSEKQVKRLQSTLKKESAKRWRQDYPAEVVHSVERAIKQYHLHDALDISSAETAFTQTQDNKLLLWKALADLDFKFVGPHRQEIEAAMDACNAPKNPQVLSKFGILRFMLGQTETAAASCQEAIRLDPAYVYAWYGLGNALGDLKRSDEAEAAYREAIRLDPTYVSAWTSLGILLGSLKRYDEAEAVFREAIRLDPTYVYAWTGLGNLLGSLKRYDEAEAVFPEATRLDPTYVYARTSLGNLLGSLKRYDETEAAFREAIRLDPTFVYAWNGLGRALGDLKRYDEAEVAFREAIRLDPTYVSARTGLGNLLGSLKRYDEAEATFGEAIRLDPTFVSAWNSLGDVLGDLKRYDEAEAAYRETIRLDPTYVFAWNSLGNLLADHLGQADAARDAYRRANALGEMAMPRANLAWLELTEGRLDAARESRQALADKSSHTDADELDPIAYDLLDSGIALVAGDVDQALTHLSQALERAGGVPAEHFDDLERLLRLFAKHGVGERLLEWFENTGFADRYLPVRAGFAAYLRGPRTLLDVNPEVRGAAEEIYRWLAGADGEKGDNKPLWPGPGRSELDAAKATRKKKAKKPL
jgi:tetratricopeptide (TPR) repeat protein